MFWERNGLRHGEFDLPFEPGQGHMVEVVDLKYNSDSSVLAIHLKVESTCSLMLYTRSNWKWYWK